MKALAKVLFLSALAVCAGICFFLGRAGVETDLLALVGAKDTLVAALSQKTSSQFRVLCADERRADLCRQAFPRGCCPFDDPIDPEEVFELVRTHGRGLLSAKQRELLMAGETNKIARSAMRRDYSGVGLFPKADDPYYFLSDFAADFRQFAPDLPEGAVLLSGDALKSPEGLQRLMAIALADEGVALSGAPFHTYLATESSKREINVLGAVSLVSVLLIGFWLFRNFRFVLPTFLSLGSGFLAGAAAVLLLPGRPHVLTFLFGTTLVGLGVDYCYHGISPEASERRESFLRSLTQALATTCLAFAPLLLSSVAVLRQMSVFTIAGLAAIYVGVVLWSGADKPEVDEEDEEPVKVDWPGRAGLPLWSRALVFALAAAGLFRIGFGNDPSSFYRMETWLAEDEAKVAAALGFADAKLAIVDFDDFARWQSENAVLKERMGVEPAGDFLTAADLPRQMVFSFDGREYLMLPAPLVEKILPGMARIVDTRGELQALFESLASETNRLLAVSFAVLLVVLVAVFRRRVLAYAAPIAASVVATAGVLGWAGASVGFFHLICFFILVGVGIDYVIFHVAGGAGRIVRASFLTSFVGFGMLAFTSFPVTSGMGIALASGLFFAYVFSMPPPRARAAEGGGWADQPQRGAGKLRMWAIFTTYRVFGKSFTKFVCFFIVLCVYPWAKPVKEALMEFVGALGIRPPRFYAFRVMLNFAWAMADKMDACCLKKSPPKMSVVGDREWMKGGCFLMSTHVGCIEVLPALRADNPAPAFAKATSGGPSTSSAQPSESTKHQPKAPFVHAFQQMGRDAIYTGYFVRHLDKSKMALHAVEDVGVETAAEMKDAIGRGEIVLMAGDRLPANSGASRREGTRQLEHEFLGRRCLWPKGVFRFAKLMESPVYAITCVRTGWNAYEVEAKRLDPSALLGDYVAFLESAARRCPLQWYQFYRFFADDAKGT